MIDEEAASKKAILLALATPIAIWWAFLIFQWFSGHHEEWFIFRDSTFVEYFFWMNVIGVGCLLAGVPYTLLAIPLIFVLQWIYKALIIKISRHFSRTLPDPKALSNTPPPNP